MNTHECIDARPHIFSLTQLFELPEQATRYIVDGLLPIRGLSLLTGRPKAGKSHLARQLVSAVSMGERFLGRDVEAGNVLYYAIEEKAEEVRDHFGLLGLRDSLGEVMTVTYVESKNPLESLIEQADSITDLRLIVIDPLMRFLRIRDGNSYSEVTAATAQLLKFVRERDLHVMTVHHTAKRLTDDPRDATLGSQAFNGAVDTILTLQEHQGNRMISSAQRYGAGLEKTPINWDDSRRYMSLGNANERELARGEEVRNAILRFLASNGCSSFQEIRSAIGVKNLTVHNECQNLIAQEVLIREGSGRRNEPFKLRLNDGRPQAVPTSLHQ